MSYVENSLCSDHVRCGGGLDAIVRVKLFPLMFSGAHPDEHMNVLDDWSRDDHGDDHVDIDVVLASLSA